MTTAAHLANDDVEDDVDLRDAILMGIDRIEHQLTLGSGGPGSAEIQQMVDLMIAHQVYYDANLQMYGGVDLRREHESDMIWTDEARYYASYAQTLLEKRGPPQPESDDTEFAQRALDLETLYESGGKDLLIIGTDEPVYTKSVAGFRRSSGIARDDVRRPDACCSIESRHDRQRQRTWRRLQARLD